jgi:hypothetical protein
VDVYCQRQFDLAGKKILLSQISDKFSPLRLFLMINGLFIVMMDKN